MSNTSKTTTVDHNNATYEIRLHGESVSVYHTHNGILEKVADGRWDDDSYTLQDMEASEGLCDAVEFALLDLV